MTKGPRLTCCLTFDFDAMSAWIGSFKSDNLSMISRGEFGAVVGLPRILDLLEKRGIRATICVPGLTACAYPTLVKHIHEQGHELVHMAGYTRTQQTSIGTAKRTTWSAALRHSTGPPACAPRAIAHQLG